MPLDLAKPGIRRLPAYGKAEPERTQYRRRTRFFRDPNVRSEVATQRIEFSLSATTATIFVCDWSFYVDATRGWPQRCELWEREPQTVHKTVYEMRPARRSLRDKAREELSEFEREYPW